MRLVGWVLVGGALIACAVLHPRQATRVANTVGGERVSDSASALPPPSAVAASAGRGRFGDEAASDFAAAPQAAEVEALLAAAPREQAKRVTEMRKHPSADLVRALLAKYREADLTRRDRTLLLFLLGCSRASVSDADRDQLLATEALPFLRGVIEGPACDATRTALLALSALGTSDAARALAAVAQDPSDGKRAEEALSALAARPDVAALSALEEAAHAGGTAGTRLRAVRTLHLVARLWADLPDPAALGAIAEARRFLAWDGRAVADEVVRGNSSAEDRAAAQALLHDLEGLP